MATWPAGLPLGWLDGSPLMVNAGVSRAEMVSGYVRQRRVMVTPFDTYNVTFIFSQIEFRAFEYFVRETLNQGDWFTGFYHDGAGQQTGTIRFVGGGYTAMNDAETGFWNITAQIEIDGRK